MCSIDFFFSRIYSFFFDFFHSLFDLFFYKLFFSTVISRSLSIVFFIQWPLDSLTAFNESEIRWRCTLVDSIYMHSTGQGKIPDAYYTIKYKKRTGIHWVKKQRQHVKKYSKSPWILARSFTFALTHLFNTHAHALLLFQTIAIYSLSQFLSRSKKKKKKQSETQNIEITFRKKTWILLLLDIFKHFIGRGEIDGQTCCLLCSKPLKSPTNFLFFCLKSLNLLW